MNPERFGPFTLIKRLGKGGIGEVFLAIAKSSSGSRKLLAIKRLLGANNADDELVSMLADEARVCLRLHHPNIVQVLDFGRTRGVHYIAMEYVDGCDLSVLVRGGRGSHVRGRPLPVPCALYAMHQIMQALDHAHRRRDDKGQPIKIIHRDVSPHNVMLSRRGLVKLTDFGLARTEISTHESRAGVVRGKFSYMPKEQAHGLDIDHRVDVFAAGVTLYEALTGTRPYSAVNLAQQLYQLEQPIVAPSAHVPNIPDEIDAIAMQALAPEPDDRYQTAALMAHDLQHELARLSTPNREAHRLSNLVCEAAPRPDSTVESLPRLSLADLPPPQESLIADALIQEQKTLAFLPRSAPIQDGELSVRSTVARSQDDGASTKLRSRSENLSAARTIARVSSDEILASSASLDDQSGDSLDRSAAAHRPSVRHARDTDDSLADLDPPSSPDDSAPAPDHASHISSRDADVVGGTIDADRQRASHSSKADSRSRGPASTARGRERMPGQALVEALEGTKRNAHREPQDALAAFEYAMAEHRRHTESEYDKDTVFIQRSSRTANIAAIALLSIALIGLGIAGGWLWRERATPRASSQDPAPVTLPGSTPGSPPPSLGPPHTRAEDPDEPPGDDRSTQRARPGDAPRAQPKPVQRAHGKDEQRSSTKRKRKRKPRTTKSRRASRRASSATRKAQPSKRRARAKAPKGGGILAVTATREAVIFVNDEPVGTAPTRLGLPAGVHRVRAVFEDETVSPVKWVNVEPGGQAKLSF